MKLTRAQHVAFVAEGDPALDGEGLAEAERDAALSWIAQVRTGPAYGAASAWLQSCVRADTGPVDPQLFECYEWFDVEQLAAAMLNETGNSALAGTLVVLLLERGCKVRAWLRHAATPAARLLRVLTSLIKPGPSDASSHGAYGSPLRKGEDASALGFEHAIAAVLLPLTPAIQPPAGPVCREGKFSESDMARVLALHGAGLGYKRLAKAFGAPVSTIASICRRAKSREGKATVREWSIR